MPDRYAVLVGCNYPGSKYPLRGCINDVNGMKVCSDMNLLYKLTRLQAYPI